MVTMSGENGYDERENGYDERENGYDERGNGYDERGKWLRGDFAIVLRPRSPNLVRNRAMT